MTDQPGTPEDGGLLRADPETARRIPRLYPLAEAAQLLHISEDYLRSKLRDRTFAGCKLAGKWLMSEQQIIAAIESSSTTVRPPDPPSPSGLSKNSRFRREVHRRLTENE